MLASFAKGDIMYGPPLHTGLRSRRSNGVKIFSCFFRTT